MVIPRALRSLQLGGGGVREAQGMMFFACSLAWKLDISLDQALSKIGYNSIRTFAFEVQ